MSSSRLGLFSADEWCTEKVGLHHRNVSTRICPGCGRLGTTDIKIEKTTTTAIPVDIDDDCVILDKSTTRPTSQTTLIKAERSYNKSTTLGSILIPQSRTVTPGQGASAIAMGFTSNRQPTTPKSFPTFPVLRDKSLRLAPATQVTFQVFRYLWQQQTENGWVASPFSTEVTVNNEATTIDALVDLLALKIQEEAEAVGIPSFIESLSGTETRFLSRTAPVRRRPATKFGRPGVDKVSIITEDLSRLKAGSPIRLAHLCWRELSSEQPIVESESSSLPSLSTVLKMPRGLTSKQTPLAFFRNLGKEDLNEMIQALTTVRAEKAQEDEDLWAFSDEDLVKQEQEQEQGLFFDEVVQVEAVEVAALEVVAAPVHEDVPVATASSRSRYKRQASKAPEQLQQE